MVQLIAILLYLGVHLSPQEANTIQFPVWDRMQTWVKVNQNAWQANEREGEQNGGLWEIEGTRVTFSYEEGRRTIDVAEYISIPTNVEWTSITELSQKKSRFQFSAKPIAISRTNNVITLLQGQGEGLIRMPIPITWSSAKQGGTR